MALSKELASMFAKAIVNSEKQTKAAETVMNATIVNDSGKMYAKIDGSDQLTPITSLTSIKNGERVSVLIKDHSATVTGNASDPSVEALSTTMTSKSTCRVCAYTDARQSANRRQVL